MAYQLNPLEKALHQRALEISQKYRFLESDLLDIIQKIDDKKVFRALGYSSLYQYCVESLHLSEGAAYNFINVARKAKEVPELKMEIKKGTITVNKAKRIAPVINKENSSLWLEKARSLSQRHLERELAKAYPKTATPEKSTYVSENRLNLQLGVSQELLDQLRRIQDILSQKKKRAVTLEESLEEMSCLFLEKNDPIQKAQRCLQRKALKKLGTCPPSVGQEKPTPAQTIPQVLLRDPGKNQHRDAQDKTCDRHQWIKPQWDFIPSSVDDGSIGIRKMGHPIER